MKQRIKVFYRKIKKKKYLLKAIKRWVIQQFRGIDKYPKTIQLPITYLCNFDCVMCGMHHMINRKDFTAEELKIILRDKLFKKVKSVGINGGEPFLKNDLVDCIKNMLDTLPELNSIFFISNGYFTESMIEKLCEIRKITKERNIKINISISVDGINDIQDLHRGKVSAFEHANRTVCLLKNEYNDLVDYLDVICTITKYNIERINEVEAWAHELGVNVAYNIATVNVRIENEQKLDDFSVFSDERSRMLAEEFFYWKYKQTGSEKYFSLYLYLKEKKRYADCPCKYNEWITITPDSQISYCATRSKALGSGLDRSAYDIVVENIEYLYYIKKMYCESCSHYSYMLNFKGLIMLYEDEMKNCF